MVTIQSQNFGVEIEMTGVSRGTAASVIANYFGVDYDSLSSLSDNRALNTFLDDANCPLLSATRGSKHGVELSIEVRASLSHAVHRFILASN